MMLPAIFISHGAPTLALQNVAARRFLDTLGESLPRPTAIVVVTAHWETRLPSVGGAAMPATIHDFGRFDDRLFAMRYNAPGDPALAAGIAQLLAEAGLQSRVDPARGLDHGVWVPLTLMYPNADIPVVPVSVQPMYGPAHHLALGRALAPLRAHGVLILASGSFTHDLARFRGQGVEATPPADVDQFAAWFDKALLEGRTHDLLAYRTLAPHAVENHPTEEHLLPLYVAMGAAGAEWHAEHLHASSTYGVLRMDSYAFS
jgi:4,5-DOPA dioxygenase extradiol